MAIKSPLYLENLTYSATDDRRLITALLPGVGVILTGDLAVAQHGAGNLSVDIAAGSANIAGSAVAGQGNYLFQSTTTVNLTIATAPGSGQSRIDLIVATIQDQDQDGGSFNQGELQVVKGTAATTGSQVAPSVPASSLVLAHIAVGPLVTSILTANITDERAFATTLAPSVPAARIHQSSAQSIANNSVTPLTNCVQDYAQGGVTTSVGGTGEIIVGATGLYHVDAMLTWAVASLGVTGHRWLLQVVKNGSVIVVEAESPVPAPSSGSLIYPANTTLGIPAGTDVELTAGDILTLSAFHVDGVTTTAVSTGATSWETFLNVRKVG